MRRRAVRPRPPAPRRPATRRGQRGLALVELALVLMPLMLLLAATADLGRAFHTFNTLAQAARGAARYLALVDASDADRRGEARNLVLYGNTEGSGSKLVADLDPDDVEICAPTVASCAGTHAGQPTAGVGTVDLVSVRISGYAYTSVFSVLLPATLGFSDIRVTMRARP